MVNTAAEAFFVRHPEVKQYEDLIRKAVVEAQRYSARRNEIAHGTVREVFNEGGASDGFFLTPHLYNPKKFPISKFPTYQYVAKNILFFAERFNHMGAKISATLHLLGKESLVAPAPRS
jgi:hypothetical protein